VNDVARGAHFYETLGLARHMRDAEGVAFFDAGGAVLSLYGRADLARDTGLQSQPGSGGITLAYNVGSEHVVDLTLEAAVKAGGKMVKQGHRVFWGGYIGYFSDPDGHIWEVAHNPQFKFDEGGWSRCRAERQASKTRLRIDCLRCRLSDWERPVISRFLPLLAASLFAAVVCVWRPLLQFYRHGSFGVNLFRSGSVLQNVRDGLLILLFVLSVGQAVAAAAKPGSAPLLVSSASAAFVVMQATGVALFLAGLALLIAAQLDLGASWQIGIDERAKPGLVTDGLYRWTRHPIYLALVAVMTGYLLLLPTILSGLLLLGTFIGIHQQASAEEAYLLRAYGDAYRDYARRVGRFLPGVRRLR
jgi:protein-S-isoprenylcysteine O-methyltransferase Ste14/catechol 2,3-dioxygenase-like lactoylglutathione lyase family enzyme